MPSFSESFGMSFDLMWGMLTADPGLTIGLLVFFGTGLLLVFIVNLIRHYNLKKSGILDVDKMKGSVFEDYLYTLLKSKGYSVQKTPVTGDYGADLVLHGNNKKIIVQAKRYKNKVGIKAVQEIAAAKSHYKADECWVITNNYYTKPAIGLAKSNNVDLVDRDKLIKWMIQMRKSA
ncbi:restriction endonuclease [Niallia taxi]|uniref:restriction endonuclease n=1 Tax=Niallia taxi TaxID=2499688 RepID=UPI0030093D4C